MSTSLSVVMILTIVGAGLVGGVFFAFSTFIMQSFGDIPAEQGINAMNSINVKIVRSAFMPAMFGTAALCVALIVWSFQVWDQKFAIPMLLCAAAYLAGVVFLTMGYHVPLNNALAAVQDPASAEAAALWQDYLKNWTRWNHVRTLTSLLPAAGLAVILWLN
ncbi:Uncharacterized membrane protein [Amycolatopsis xylanica]|uniref:Uncharacterized membrane protein n=1 Tax=Amycolatopsis xylanica TaxID=589385 RepID=A0A1H3QAC3_9PSEU|nr:anthrone oxygenase family protein [Amycolatopsis xylanica]SDZ10213.1 Uncharacterized membrane protein [Amycolatopsis xylanica]